MAQDAVRRVATVDEARAQLGLPAPVLA
jgi:hypothetical protein